MDGGPRVPVPLTREDDRGGEPGLVVADGPVDVGQDVFSHPHELGRALGHPVADGRVIALSPPVADCRVLGTLEPQGPDQGLADAEVGVIIHTVK